MAQLICKCWSEDPASRPTFEQMDSLLEAARMVLSDEERAWLDDPNGHAVYVDAEM